MSGAAPYPAPDGDPAARRRARWPLPGRRLKRRNPGARGPRRRRPGAAASAAHAWSRRAGRDGDEGARHGGRVRRDLGWPLAAIGASIDERRRAQWLTAGSCRARRDPRQLCGQGCDRPQATSDRGPSGSRTSADQALVPLGARDLLDSQRRRRSAGSSPARARSCSHSQPRSASAVPTSACTTRPTCSPGSPRAASSAHWCPDWASRRPRIGCSSSRSARTNGRAANGAPVSTSRRGVKIGIVGLPNAGKSTLFNALTQAGAETGDYAFTTIDPNVAVVGVPDERLERVAETVGSSEAVHETIEFHDIAGLVRGASQGEGLGNQFLAAIRETDAICHVVRCPRRGRRPPSRGPGRPARRHRADRDRAAGRRPRAGRAAARAGHQAGPLGRQGGDRRAATGSSRWSRRSAPGGRSARCRRPRRRRDAPRRLSALTSKPVLYVANVDEGVDKVPAPVLAHAERARRRSRCRSGPGRGRARRARRRRRGGRDARRAGRVRVGPGAADPRRLRAARADRLLHRRRGQGGDGSQRSGAARPPGRPPARSTPRSRRAFVRAEVVAWDDLVEAGGYAAARDRGLLRTEGRDYVIADGDVITIKT